MSPGTTTKKRLAVTLAAALATSGLAAAVLAAPAQAAPAAPAATCPTSIQAGASVPFTEVQAECSANNGTLIGPDYTQGSVASEAVGRQAVTLSGQGQYVEFTTPSATNSIDLRYSLPQGKSGNLAVYVNGTKLGQSLALTSKYSYLNTGQIGGSKTHKLFDETRMLLGQNVSAGAKIKVQVDAEDTAGPYTIDLADFEQVAGAASAPANSVSLTSYGATPNDGTDDSSAFRNAIAGAKSQGKELWIPPGTFDIGQAVQVDQVTIRGAGPWYSVLHGNNVFNNGSASGNIKLYNFAVFGEISDRNDGSPDNAFHGVLGAGSVVSGLWIQHTKCGIWLMSGASSNLTIENNRILDTTADGINFDGAVTNSTLHNNFLRNNGDDGLALWSNGSPDSGNTLSNNTVEVPTLANGIALYGGANNTVTGNLVQDTNALGGGILVGNRFSSVPLSGTITVSNNTTVRAGALDPNWQFGVGALWFDARDEAITGVTINVTNFHAVDSPYEAIQFIDGNGAGKVIQGINVNGATIDGTGTFAVQSQTQGSVGISNLTASRVGVTGTYNCPYPTSNPPMSFTGSGNNGLTGTWTNCATWPPPNSGPPAPPTSGSNAALGRPASASGSQGGFPPGNAVDGNSSSYWESTNNAFPQSLTVDLGASTSVNKVTLKLPPASAWNTRTQTLTIQGSNDGNSYSTVVASRGYTFDPASGNSVTVTFPATSQRYLRLNITGNTGWPAGQISEFEVDRA
jgi:hypothetical protein